MSELQANESQILLYQTEDGRQRIEVLLEEGTVWLSQKQMSELFQTTPQNINIHFKNIFSEGEIAQGSVIKDSLLTAIVSGHRAESGSLHSRVRRENAVLSCYPQR